MTLKNVYFDRWPGIRYCRKVIHKRLILADKFLFRKDEELSDLNNCLSHQLSEELRKDTAAEVLLTLAGF